jgi:hypothetical protein
MPLARMPLVKIPIFEVSIQAPVDRRQLEEEASCLLYIAASFAALTSA